MKNRVHMATVTSVVFVALAGCEDGQGFPSFGGSDESADTETVVQQGPQTVLKDVERPDIFNVTDMALWDGRPSLGGVWVAHPDITTPERVIITNTSNGKSIPGALFRRERDNPGPVIQASSEAASALGMLAGAPTQLKILAVRQEEVVIEPAPLPVSDADQLSDEELSAAGVVDDVDADASESIEEPPKRGNFFQRLFGRKRTDDAAVAAAAAGAAATADDASSPEVETTTLDPVTTGAAAAIARAEATDKPKPRPERTAAAPAPSGVKNPFIQVGLFSVEANANAAAANLRQSGIIPTIQEDRANDALAWRVLVGPVTTADDQAALLGQVKNLGYTDAFLTPN